MGIIRKIKTWWNSTTTAERILSVLGITSTATAICATAYGVHKMNETKHSFDECMEDGMNVSIRLYSKGQPHLQDLEELWDGLCNHMLSKEDITKDPNLRFNLIDAGAYNAVMNTLGDMITAMRESEKEIPCEKIN